MPATHIALALVMILIWGCNFIFLKFGLDEITPLLLCAVRFFFASVPAIFFIKPPDVPFQIISSYGLVMFALQFALLFVGMQAGMTPGMASLVLQTQVFFSIIFAGVFLGERLNPWQIIGGLIAFLGIGVVALHFDKNVSLMGFLFILAAAASCGLGTLIIKKIKTTRLISVVVWSSFVACVPMTFLALLIEKPASFIAAYAHLTYKGGLSLLYIVYASTWLGYGIWNWLVSRHPVGLIAPFTLLVPIVGIMSSVVVLHEPLPSWKLTASLLVIMGLVVNLLSKRIMMLNSRSNLV